MNDEQEDLAPLGPVDESLQFWIDKTNEGALDVGLTLLVGGLLISGQTVSVDAYFDRQHEQFIEGVNLRSPSDASNPEQVRSDMRRKHEEEKSARHSGIQPVSGSRFIHLKDVSIMSAMGQRIVIGADAWWRIRLDKVDGWLIGLPRE